MSQYFTRVVKHLQHYTVILFKQTKYCITQLVLLSTPSHMSFFLTTLASSETSHTITMTIAMPDGAYKTVTMRFREANFPTLKQDSDKNVRLYLLPYICQTNIQYFFASKA